MSQKDLSHKIERKCEGCGQTTEFELVGITQETVIAMTGWYTVIREVLDPESGRFVKLLVQACSLPCVPAAAVKIALPEIPADDIDLESLRAIDPNAN